MLIKFAFFFKHSKNIWRVSLVKNGEEVVSVGGAVDPRWTENCHRIIIALHDVCLLWWLEFVMTIIILIIIEIIMITSWLMFTPVFSHKNSGNSASSSIVLQLTKVNISSASSCCHHHIYHHHHQHIIMMITGGSSVVPSSSSSSSPS